MAWPASWTVFTTLKESDVDLAKVDQMPHSIGGVSGQSLSFTNGTLSLLEPGEKPTLKKAAFIFGTVHSNSARTVLLGCAANWWMECRLNGAVMCDTLQTGEVRKPEQRILQLPLKRGDNLLAFKVLSGKGGWSLSLLPPAEVPANALAPFDTSKENTLLDTDFQNAEVKTYDSGQTIGNGPETSQMTANQLYRVSKVMVNAGDDPKHYLMFTSDNTTTLTHPTCAAVKVIPYNIANENNLYLKASVRFTPLSIPDGAVRGNVDLMIMSTTLNLLNAPMQIGFINIRPSFLKKYESAGKQLHIELSIDFSDKVQHTWEYRLYAEGNPTPLFSSGPLKTRDPLGRPALFALTGSGNPYLAINSVRLTAGSLNGGQAAGNK